MNRGIVLKHTGVLLTAVFMVLSTALPLVNSLKINNNINDQVDQQQTEVNFCKEPSDTWCWAQSFKPTLPILTRVEIMVSGGYKCSIRSGLSSSDLTSVTKNFPSPPHNWHFFDFPDIPVNPESTYYIILIPQNTDASICGAFNTAYTRGCMYMSEDGGATWGEPLDQDMQFKTYGTSEGCDEFMGLCVEPLGDALLDIGDELRVYNLDDDGDDGVMVDLEGYNTYTCNLEGPFEPDIETTLNFEFTGKNGKVSFWMELQINSKGEVRRGERALDNAHAIIGFGPDGDIVFDKELDKVSDLGFIVDDNSNNNLQFSGIYCAMCPLSWIGQSIIWQHPVQWTWEEHDVDELPIKKLMIRGIVENVEAESYISSSSISSIGIDGFTILEHYAYALDAPAEPRIDGPTKGSSGKAYDYEINNIGISNVYFLIDWDDDSELEYTDLTSTGVTKTVSHTWTADGTYNIKVRAMNEWGMMSDWAELGVTIPKKKVINRPILNLLEDHLHLFPILKIFLNIAS